MPVEFQENEEAKVKRNNDDSTNIFLINILDNEEYRSAGGRLPVPIGITENGRIIRDLSSIPHILICGSTGTGKTSFVQTLLAVLLSEHSPEDVKVLIYDSKGTDYKLFSNVPHLFYPIVYERNAAVEMLTFLAEESRHRLQLFAKAGCKNYAQYNDSLPNYKLSNYGKKLPELFVILDDLSSLLLYNEEMTDLLNVLLDGRITGIHAIVISSLTARKALHKQLFSYIPCKICFYLSTKVESRRILDQSGAETLFVPGEIIYKFQNDVCRCQSTYVAYENIESIIKNEHYASEITELEKRPAISFPNNPVNSGTLLEYTDEVYDVYLEEAAVIIFNMQRASIGVLQRKLNIGFNRAERIMNQLYSLGVVGKEYGTKPRDILMSVDDWNNMCASHNLREIINTTGPNNTSGEIQHVKIPRKRSEYPYVVANKKSGIKLRDFREFTINGTKISIHHNKVHYTKSIMTLRGDGFVSPVFSGDKIANLIYKKASLFKPGYMTFEFEPDTTISINNPDLLHADINNISELIKVEFGIGQDIMLRLFLKQLSEDIGLPIKYL